MNRGHVLQSSPVQQMMAAGSPNWWNINSMRSPTTTTTTTTQQSSSPFFPPPHHPSFLIPQFAPTTNSSSPLPFLPSWQDNTNNQSQELPESWGQLLLGGLVGEDDKTSGMRQLIYQAKKLEDWEEQMSSQAHSNTPVEVADVKQEFVYGHPHGNGNSNEDFQSAALCSLSQIMPAATTTTASSASSPKSSCVTSFTSSNMLDFSNKAEMKAHPPPNRSSSECNSSANGGAAKKARVQPSSSAQPTFKVRKEKLGDRITALHQLVSPFGKTDTASVLLEAIGYIRFLQSQIEALSLPYLGSGSPNMRQQQQQSAVHGERNCMFPEDPGQLLNDNCMKRKSVNSEQDAYEEPKKDLRSRGLCLVPVSCTLQVGSDNGADYWAPAALGGGFQ